MSADVEYVDKAISISTTSLETIHEEFGLNAGFDIGLEMPVRSSALDGMIDNISHGEKIVQLGLKLITQK